MIPQSLSSVRRAFEREFWPVAGKFDHLVLAAGKWRDHSLNVAARPGVYVWFDGDRERIIKVGMSLVNARARALNHLRDDTGGAMAALADQPLARMVLFTLDEADKHWATALEIYLERVLDPEIKSER